MLRDSWFIHIQKIPSSIILNDPLSSSNPTNIIDRLSNIIQMDTEQEGLSTQGPATQLQVLFIPSLIV